MAPPKAPAPGRSKPKICRDALMRSLHREVDKNDKTQRLERVADALVRQAMAGDVAAIKEIHDRVDGRVPQQVAGDEEGGPVRILIGWLTGQESAAEQAGGGE